MSSPQSAHFLELHHDTDSSVSPRTASPLRLGSPSQYPDNQPRIASPLRLEHTSNGTHVAATSPTGAKVFSPFANGMDRNKSLPQLPTEFPFTAAPGMTGQQPTTNELVRIPSGSPGQEATDVPTGLASPASGNLSRKATSEAGASSPQGRRSVQFARHATATLDSSLAADHSREQSWTGDNAEGAGKEKLGSQLLSKLKALASPSHGRSLGSSSAGGEPSSEDRSTHMLPEEKPSEPHFYEDDADAEESATENATEEGGQSRRRRRKFRRANTNLSVSAPTTPKASKMASLRRDSMDRTPNSSASHGRPTFLPRRNTMSDIPENRRLAISEDEGRDRLAREGLWRRGSAWAQKQTHRGQSFTAGPVDGTPRQNKSDEPLDSKRPSGLRRLTTFGAHGLDSTPSAWRLRAATERTSTLSTAKWRSIKAGLKMLVAKKKEERRIEQAKSAELMAELLAGAPAALFVASMFQRDERGNKRIPVLLEQLRIKITDSEAHDGERHQVFRIELEYASSIARMKWVIKRSLTDFIKLYSRYRVQNTTEKLIHSSARHSERSTLPKFPKSLFPVLRNMRAEEFGEEDWEDEENEHTAGEQSGLDGEASAVDRPGHGKRRGSSFNLLRKKSGLLGSRQNNAIDEHALSGSITGPFGGKQRQETFPERQRRKLEEFIQKMVTYVMFRPDSNRLCRFLELSALGVRLAPEGGYHGKEGFMAIKSSKGVDYRRQLNFNLIKARHTPKWFLVRHSYVVCVDSPEEMNIYEVILVDSDFVVEKKSEKRKRDEKPKELAIRAKESANLRFHQLRISNSERLFKLLSRSREHQQQFLESINFMKDNTLWSKQHRYDSFAPVRQNVRAQFLVDGRDYMWNVSRAINMAKDVIYIHDWWLSPEIYLRRPPAISQRWRLDRLLKKKAEEGVKIYVIMYRNINSAIPIDSEYSKFALLGLHKNVFVQRSPNQLRSNTFFWAHHEKIVVVDHCVAFCGGVDLCFGRWDIPSHPVFDDRETGFERNGKPTDADHCQLWAGKDYSNPRVQDFYNLHKPYEEMYDRSKVPRMPWHDIGMQIAGQPARDLARHFVQRWNFALRQRTPTRPTPFLLPPTDFLPADLEAMGLRGTCQIQILRSAGLWSLGTPNRVECSIMNAYVHMINNSDHFIYIENQFFITSCLIEGTRIENSIGDALVDRIIRAHENDEDWRAVIIIPLMPGFQNTVDAQDGSSVRLIMTFQFRSICRGETSIFARLRAKGIEPEDFIQFYALRSWGKIGPEKTLVTEQLYIHAKCMIADDRVAIIGSANINERSMLGFRDSEVAAIVQDMDMLPSTMAGRPYQVSRFAHELRVRLMREHLGLDTDKCREHELWQRDMEKFQKRQEEPSSLASPEPDHVVEQKLIRNQHRLQEDLIARQDKLHSFNHDTWLQQNNPNIITKKKRTTDPRVTDNKDWEADVLGAGFDGMLEHELDGTAASRDTLLDSYGREVLVASLAKKEHGGLHMPSKRRRRAQPSPPDPEPANLPPPLLKGMNTAALGLPRLSQLPALPVGDDTDIGGPPLPAHTTSGTSTNATSPLLSEMKRPHITKDCMQDPILDTFFLDTWHTVAENNTKIFRQVFRCMPDSDVLNWRDYREYSAFAERFSQAQGAGKSRDRLQQEAKGKSGPPGNGIVGGIIQVAKVVGEMDDKISNELSSNNRDNLPMGTVEDWAKEQEKRVQDSKPAEFDEKDSVRKDEATVLHDQSQTGKTLPDASSIGKGLERNRAVTISEPSKEQDSRTGPTPTPIPTPTAGGSQRKRRRGTTSRRPFMAGDDDAMLSKQNAEELLNLVQGHLVCWPYDWLAQEEKGGKWLYAVDKVAPWEIYT